MEDIDLDLFEKDATEPIQERFVLPFEKDNTEPIQEHFVLLPKPNEEIELDYKQDDLTLPIDTRPSYINLAFFDITLPNTPRELTEHEGFRSGRTYQLVISISPEQDKHFTKAGEQTTIERPSAAEEWLLLLVVVRPEGDTLQLIGSRKDTIEWPLGVRSTKSANFILKSGGISQHMYVPLHISVFYRNNLLFSATLSIEIAPESHSWTGGTQS